jgi:major capsid protein E
MFPHRSDASLVTREKSQLSLFSPPFIKPVRMLTADDTFYRNMNMGAGGMATNRDAELLILDEQELDNDISRREEWMVVTN